MTLSSIVAGDLDPLGQRCGGFTVYPGNIVYMAGILSGWEPFTPRAANQPTGSFFLGRLESLENPSYKDACKPWTLHM